MHTAKNRLISKSNNREWRKARNEGWKMNLLEMIVRNGLRKTSEWPKANSDSGCGTQCRVQLEAGQKIK